MGFELSREDFSALPLPKQNLVIYDNIISIKKDVSCFKGTKSNQNIKFYLGYAWLFVLTVAMGFRKFIPFI